MKRLKGIITKALKTAVVGSALGLVVGSAVIASSAGLFYGYRITQRPPRTPVV